MKKIFWLFVAIIPQVGMAQVTDTFSDGDFIANPVWQGAAAKFLINEAGQLQLNDNAVATAYLSTPFVSDNLDNFEWRFYIKMTFAPSAGNFGRVYLTSDSEDLTGPLNGYYLQFGEAGSNDAIRLFRQSVDQVTPVCSGMNGQIANSFALWIKVTRDENANWQLLIATSEDGDYVLEASGNDAAHTSSAFMGVRSTYTASNANKFFFDDFFAGDPLFDNTPPQWVQTEATSQNTLVISFSEKITAISATSTSNYLLNSSQQPTQVSLLPDEKTIELTFAQAFENASNNLLAVQGILDLAGNEMTADEKEFFFFEQETIQHSDIIFSEIMADPSPPQTLPEAEFIEIFNRSNKVINLNNIKLIDAGAEIILPEYFLFPDAYVLLTSNASALLFSNIENVIGVSSFPTLTNAGELLLLKNLNNQTIDSLQYDDDWYKDDDKKSGGFSLERINQHNFCVEDAENWQATLSEDGGTPGAHNSVLNNTFDTEPPSVTSIAVESSNVIKVHFSEKLFEELPNASQFLIQPAAIIGNLSFANDERSTIDIIFQEALQSGITYSLKTSNVKDCPGNTSALLHDAGSFVLAEEASFQDIIITEILPDPSPVVGLPETEFIELYNRSNKTINLNKFKITDGSSVGIIPDFILTPNQYVLLLPETVIHQYDESTPHKVTIKNFPTLNNTGETISLLDSVGQRIDSIRYSLDWYHDEDKQSGGWSLERMDLNNFCFEKENWKASVATMGGTPGFQNSVYTTILDNATPILSSVFAENDNTLLLSFNEKLHENSTSQLEIALEPGRDIQSISFGSNGYNEINLELAQPLLAGEVYQLRLRGARDCSGNVMLSESISQPFGISSQATWKDIIINEVMADPSPARTLPEAEYIEIFNRSNKLIDLHNWTLKDNSNTISLTSATLLPDSFLILCSAQHAQLFSQHGETLGLSNFPSLSNSGEFITLRNAEGTLIDSVNYKGTWYLDVDKKDGGWSLELIDKQNICSEETNWAASEGEAGGTPGKENSIAGAKPDLMGPMLVEGILISPETLQMNFDEKLDKTIPSVNAFVIDPALDISTIQFTDNTLRSLTVSFSTPAEENILYNIEITQLFDCAGNGIQEDHKQTTFVLPQQAVTGDVVINEILFNPLSGGVDFVELLNVSSKYINLKNWKLTNLENDGIINERNITSANTVLHPNSYMVFTSDKEQLLNHYPQSTLATFLETNLPSLPDNEGSIALADSLYNILDHFLYSESMHSKLLKSFEGVSLEKISPTGNANNPAMWRSGVVGTGFASPGYKNANLKEAFALTDEIKVEPEIFEPIYGQPNYTSISYKFNQGGYAANAKIYDAQGRLVKTLTNNEVLASEGFMTWDGDQDDGTKAHIGYYTLWLEVFDNTGFVKTFRKRVVVATRF